MASWMVHLRVADKLLEKIENLDEEASGTPEEKGDILDVKESEEAAGEGTDGLLEIEGLEPLTAEDADDNDAGSLDRKKE